MKTKFKKVIIPEFIFTDGSLGVFSGFDRDCYPEGPKINPVWIWTLGLFDVDGNYFVIELDTRKKLKTPTIFHDEKPTANVKQKTIQIIGVLITFNIALVLFNMG